MAHDSVDKQLSFASEDCRTCKRRRISCDRALPQCRKCGTRSLECPGYGLTLKWMASSTPNVRRHENESPANHSTTQIVSRQANFTFNQSQLEIDNSRASQATPDQDEKSEQATCTFGLVKYLCHDGSPFQDPLSRELLHHYDKIFAPQMVWVDSSENPWRQTIIPLALQSPALMMSIFSVAAGDIWSRRNNPASHPLWAGYREHTVSLLTKHLQAANDGGRAVSNAPATDHPSTVLAAVLLAFVGLRVGRHGEWRLHLKAASTMIEHWNSSVQITFPELSSIKEFLLQELYFYKVWTSITAFRPADEFSEEQFTLGNHGPFIQYTGILQKLGEIERRRGEMAPGTGAPCDLSIPLLETILDEARKRTMSCRESVTVDSPAARRVFELVADMLHHAGILFGCNVLARDQYSIRVREISRNQLFNSLKTMHISELNAQDLPWPVFMAGTECRGDIEKQHLVEARMQEIMRLSGPLQRPRALRFLRHLWHLQAQTQCSGWISLARLWADNGEPLLLI